MNRYETNSKGTAPALSALLNKFADMPRSAFDETRRKVLDVFPYGIIPIECFLMFPNSDMYVKYDISAITKNPTIRRILSSMQIETRTYVGKCSDFWEGWNNFITRGRSGKVNLSIPTLNSKMTNTANASFSTHLPYNPYSYLNIIPPFKFHDNQSVSSNTGLFDLSDSNYKVTGLLGGSFNINTSNCYNSVSALPGVMYCKIAKEYQNSNLLQDNPYWYPENENHDLILPYNATSCNTACYDLPQAVYLNAYNGSTLTDIQPTNNKNSIPWLNVLYYRQRKGNYFNTGSPFPDLIRGDVPTLDVLSAKTIFPDSIFSNSQSTLEWFLGADSNGKLSMGYQLKNDPDYPFNVNADAVNSTMIDNSNSNLLKSALNYNTISGINFSMAEWRRLATMTVFKERMARTDGSYNQMIQAQFQHNPKWHEHSVKYCGGSSQPIVFSEVVQTSENGSTPLGTTGGRAVSSSGNDEISIHVDDYSIMMTVLTITPDDYYTQGVDRMWSELTQAEQYFPILNNLNPQAIKNKELFISGNDSIDEDVFNYQELFSHFKSRQNQVSGLMALPISKVGDTGAYIFNRLFNSAPSFNNAFVTGKMTSNEELVFASTSQAQFILSIVSQMKYVAPMPAVTQPSDMGLSY